MSASRCAMEENTRSAPPKSAKRERPRRAGNGKCVRLWSVGWRPTCWSWTGKRLLTSGEFCSAQRRIAHLLTMYGFVLYVVTTVIMVAYPTPATPTPAILPVLWYIGALMVCLGGYWFWFFIRADVAAEGNSPFRIVQADLFVLGRVADVVLASE